MQRLTPEETTACFHDFLPPREPFYFFKHISSGTLSDISTDIHTLHSRLLKESAPKENVLQVANCYLEHFSDIAKEYKLNRVTVQESSRAGFE